MTTEVKNVYDVLPDVLNDIAKNKEWQREIEDYLSKKHGMLRGTFIEVVANHERLDTFNEEQIAVIVNAIYEITKDGRVFPSNFYSAKEIKNIVKYRFQREEKLTLPQQYEKVLQGSEKDYVMTMSYRDIVRHKNDDLWLYNLLTQRSPVKKRDKKTGKVRLEPKVNRRNVREIKDMLLDETFLPDSPIVINVLNDGNDEIFYNEEDWSLLIESATECDVLDGYHRIVALLEVFEQKPDLEGYLYVSFRNYDLEQAQAFLGQFNSFSTFNKSHTRKLKSRDLSDKIVKELETKCEALRGRIADNTSVRINFNEITNFAILSETIKSVFDPQNQKEKFDITQMLILFFDYLFGSFEEAFVKNVKEVGKTSWINHHNTFVLYVVLAGKLYEKYGKNIPVDEIPRIVNAIDFSKEISAYHKAILPEGQAGKTNAGVVRKTIKRFAEETISNLL